MRKLSENISTDFRNKKKSEPIVSFRGEYKHKVKFTHKKAKKKTLEDIGWILHRVFSARFVLDQCLHKIQCPRRLYKSSRHIELSFIYTPLY